MSKDHGPDDSMEYHPVCRLSQPCTFYLTAVPAKFKEYHYVHLSPFLFQESSPEPEQ